MRILAVIPSDPLEIYVKKGMGGLLEDYYNPRRFFDKVYLLSPMETEKRRELGMEVVPTSKKELAARLKELKVDVVRAYGGYWASDMAACARVEGIPVVVSVHDTNPVLLHDSVREADVVWCVSGAVRDFVVGRFGRPERTWLFSDRVDMGSIKPLPPEAAEDLIRKYPARYRILHVGRKEPQKNLDTLLRALKCLGDDYFLLAIGHGDTAFYEDMARREGVAGQCAFIDSVENFEIPRYQAWAHCMCVPSRWEGFGIVFIEALACRSVVVTSDIAPMNEYITHLDNGVLVRDYEDPRALADAVRTACLDEGLRERIKSVARESVEKFDVAEVTEKEAAFYARVLEMRASGAFRRSSAEKIHLFLAKVAGKAARIPEKINRRVRNIKAGS